MSSICSKKGIIRVFEIIISILLCVILIFLIFANCSKTKKYLSVVRITSAKFSVETSLILAVIKVESNFNEKAVSNKGALGLMQVTENTFEYVCTLYNLDYTLEDTFDVTANITVGTAYLNYLFKKFKTEKEVLAAYNAGEGNLYNWLSNQSYSDDGKTLKKIPYKETLNYVRKVAFYKNCYYKKFD